MDLTDQKVKVLLKEHVDASDCDVEKLFAHPTDSHKQAARWPEIFKHRHVLSDLIVLTRGNLLRMTTSEDQAG